MNTSSMSLFAMVLAVFFALLSGFFYIDSQQARSERLAAERNLQELSQRNRELDNKLTTLAGQNEQLRESLSAFNQQQDGLSDVVEELRSELTEVTARHQQLVQTQEKTVERLESANRRLEQLRDVEAENAELRESRRKLDDQLSACRANQEELGIERNQLRERLAQCEAELEEEESEPADEATEPGSPTELQQLEWQPPR